MDFNKVYKFLFILKDMKFLVTNQNIERFFTIYVDNNIVNIEDNSEEDVLAYLEICFCKTPSEVERLRELWYSFETILSQMEDAENSLNSIREYSKERTKLLKDNREELSNVKQNNRDSKIEKLQEYIENNKLPDSEKYNELLDNPENIENTLEELTEQAQKQLEDIREALLSEDEKKFEQVKKDYKELNKILQHIKKMKQKIKKELQEEQKLQDAINKKMKELAESQEAESEYNQSLKEAKSNLKSFKKEKSKEFYSYNDSIIDSETFDFLNKSISAVDTTEIERYIRKNARKFQHKLNSNIVKNTRNVINIQQTIKNTMKTNRLPLLLEYNNKKPKKTNLVLFLDISGSCIHASKTMLTLVYYLQKTFPGGVKVFAFVNTLYDITSLLKTNDIQEAIDDVFELIPTRNVYSNYAPPIASLYKKHIHLFNNTTRFVVIGDARNNRYESNDITFKLITDKAKKTYWLNTEEQDSWDTGDSVISQYSQYCTDVLEVVNLSQLFNFIENID